MADLLTLISQMQADGTFARLARDPRAQFGPVNRRYIGAEILPELDAPANAYQEDGIRYRTVIANSGGRYSPAQKKAGGAITGSFRVDLGHQDIAAEFTGRDYDALVRLVGQGGDMQAAARIVRWADVALNQALIEETERQRWEALVNASTTLVGDNGWSETVTYPNPSGHRVAAGGTWSSNTYDPYNDITAQAQVLKDKGFMLRRIITSTRVVSILARNQKIAARAGSVRVLSTSDVFGRVSQAELNGMMQADGLPPIETYDLLYRTQTGSGRFMADTVMVFLADADRDVTIDWGDTARYLPGGVADNALGYTAIGFAVGEPNQGRVMRVWARDNKPPRLEGEAWQTSLPVIQSPESIAVITGIA